MAHPSPLPIEPLEPRQLLSAGDVDATFGRHGSTVVPEMASLVDVGIASSGKILILGSDSPPTVQGQQTLVRLNVDGSADASFHAETVPFLARRLFLQSDGKMVVFGTNPARGTADTIRYNADGSADNTFNGGRAVETAVPHLASVAVRQADGKIVYAFTHVVGGSGSGTDDETNYGVIRLNADGTLDRTFGTNGEALSVGSVGAPGALGPADILVDPSGNIAVIGYRADAGGVDSPYSILVGPGGGSAVNGGINVPFLSESRFGGGSEYDSGVVRPDGTPVATFSGHDFDAGAYVGVGNQWLLLDPDPAVTGVVRPGNVVNAGGNAVAIAGVEGREIAVARIGADGRPDAAYGFAGTSAPLRIAPRRGNVSSAVVAQAPDGALVVAGTVYPGDTFAGGQVYVARFAGGARVGATRGPAASLDVIPDATLDRAGVRHLTFDVKYTGAGGIDAATLDGLDLRVVGDNGFSRYAEFVGIDNFQGSDGQYAIYSVRGPGGHWNANDAGDYHVILRSRQVRDAAGRPAPAGEIGSFHFSGGSAAAAAVARAVTQPPFASSRRLNDVLVDQNV